MFAMYGYKRLRCNDGIIPDDRIDYTVCMQDLVVATSSKLPSFISLDYHEDEMLTVPVFLSQWELWPLLVMETAIAAIPARI
jgi:hypothetical protein